MKRIEFPLKTDRFQAKSFTTNPLQINGSVKHFKISSTANAGFYNSTSNSVGVHQTVKFIKIGEMKDTTQWFIQLEYWGLHPKT